MVVLEERHEIVFTLDLDKDCKDFLSGLLNVG